MKVLILSLSEYSLGELHNAIFFARQVRDSGGEVFFIVPPGHEKYTRETGFQVVIWQNKSTANEGFVRQVIAEHRPDVVVLADYYNLFLEKPVINPELVIKLGIPVATFDSMNFAPGPTLLEKEILRKSRFGQTFAKGLQFCTQLPALPPELAVLLTCPVNKPVQQAGALTVTLYKEPLFLSAGRRAEVRSRFGLAPGEKLVMLAKATWAYLAVKIRAMEQSRALRFSYGHFLQQLLQLYMQEIPSPVMVLGVGPQMEFNRGEGQLRFASLPFLGLEEYQELLLAADLFISDNITSCSVAKAIMGGIPALVLTSALISNGDGTYQAPFDLQQPVQSLLQKWEKAVPGSIFPFLVYPFGWHRELAPLLQDNPYREALVETEMFVARGTGKIIASMLLDEESKKALADRQSRYCQTITALPGAVEALQWVMQEKKRRL